MNPTVVCAAAMPPGTTELPVAIVGSGACGLTAALMLRDAGIDCVLLERDARPQGSTALSSGFIPAAGTGVQQAAGVHDHYNVAFTKAGLWEVGITVSGTHVTDGVVSDSGTFRFNVVPEPSTALLGGLGLLAMFRRRR